MDTTGMSRAEVDRLRELAAKAHQEGVDWGQHCCLPPTAWERQETARQWAEEELPYPQGAER